MKKITRATVKSFIRRHRDHLFIRVDSRIGGYDDFKGPIHGATFNAATVSNLADEITLGVEGAWFLGRGSVGGDSFEIYQRDGYEGIEVFNGMCNFVLAVRSEVLSAEKLAAELPRASAAPSRCRM